MKPTSPRISVTCSSSSTSNASGLSVPFCYAFSSSGLACLEQQQVFLATDWIYRSGLRLKGSAPTTKTALLPNTVASYSAHSRFRPNLILLLICKIITSSFWQSSAGNPSCPSSIALFRYPTAGSTCLDSKYPTRLNPLEAMRMSTAREGVVLSDEEVMIT